jgi:hypothetical protein
MPSCRHCSFRTKSRLLAALCSACLLSGAALAAEGQEKPPEAPPVSKFAAAAPLVEQVQWHIDNLAKSFASPRYTEALQTRVAKDANVLIVLLTAIGLHDEETPLKASAPRLVELSEELMNSVMDQAKAKAAYDALVQAMKDGATGGKPLAWEPRFQLGLLMKQVTTTNNQLRGATREARFARSKKDAAARVAALAVIGQAIHADTHEVKDPAKVGEWYKYASEMRDAAGAVGEAIAKDDFAAVQATMKRLQTNCNACHEAFRLAPVGAAEEAAE